MEKRFYNLSAEERMALTREARESGLPLMIRWAEVEPDFGEGWRHRAAAAAEWLADAASVADLGCGTMRLEQFLRPGQSYIPVDLARRDERTLVLDLNEPSDLARLPAADACALLGVLEYSYAPDLLLAALHDRYAQVVMSFNALRDDQDIEHRLANGWVNHFTRADLLDFFTRLGFTMTRERLLEGKRHERVFDFRRAPIAREQGGATPSKGESKENQSLAADMQKPDVFFADCGGPFDLTPDHTISSFESQPTSEAEVAIIAFLKSEPRRYAGKRLLHVGVGNSSLPAELAADLARYIGITISLPEIAQFEQKFAGVENAKAVLLNKYDRRMYAKLNGEFDIIVDTLLKSFACCEKHFGQMMKFFTSKLRSGGTLITTETGVQWGWKGNTKRAYTPGAQVDPSIGRFRVLGRDNLRRLGERLGLTMNSVNVPNSKIDPAADDHILILTKK
jgi:hypothetical protein